MLSFPRLSMSARVLKGNVRGREKISSAQSSSFASFNAQDILQIRIEDSPDLSHIVSTQPRLPKDLLRDLSRDEPTPRLIPSSEDLIVVLLLVLCEDPGNLGSSDGLVLVELRISRQGKEVSTKGKKEAVLSEGRREGRRFGDGGDARDSSTKKGFQLGDLVAGRRALLRMHKAGKKDKKM